VWQVKWANYLKIGLAFLLITVLARAVYSVSREGGWLLLSMIAILTAIKLLVDHWLIVAEPRRARRRRARVPRVLVLHRLLRGLPKTSNAVCYILKGMLLEKLSLRTGLPPSTLEERASEYVNDEKLRKLLRGDLTLKSRREVDEIIDRIRRL